MEAGEYRAEARTEVVGKDEADPDALLPCGKLGAASQSGGAPPRSQGRPTLSSCGAG